MSWQGRDREPLLIFPLTTVISQGTWNFERGDKISSGCEGKAATEGSGAGGRLEGVKRRVRKVREEGEVWWRGGGPDGPKEEVHQGGDGSSADGAKPVQGALHGASGGRQVLLMIWWGNDNDDDFRWTEMIRASKTTDPAIQKQNKQGIWKLWVSRWEAQGV